MKGNELWADDLYRLVGQSISQKRKNQSPRGLTQKQLADRTGGKVSRSSIANIERGLQHVSIAQLYVLAHALNLEVGEFLPARSRVFGIESAASILGKSRKPLSEKDREWLLKLNIERTGQEETKP